MRQDSAPLHIRQGRSGRPWRRLQAEVFATEVDCWLCGAYVDQSLPSHDDMARSVDHVVALALGGDPLSRSNARLAHRICNSQRSTTPGMQALTTRNPSRRWS